MNNGYLHQIDTFPVSPLLAEHVMRSAQSIESTLPGLQHLVEIDFSMAVEVLKRANSPFFGIRRNVATIKKAFSVLGTSEIKQLAFAKIMFHTAGIRDEFDIILFLKHSYYCALVAQEIAQSLTISVEPDEFFAAGLIHDIGKIGLQMSCGTECAFKGIDAFSTMERLGEESTNFNICHDRLGMQLLNKWTFPSSLVIAVGFHHTPTEASELRIFPLVVFIANIISHIYECEQTSRYSERPLLEEMLMAPEICKIAEEEKIELRHSNLEIWLDKLRSIIISQPEISSLFSS